MLSAHLSDYRWESSLIDLTDPNLDIPNRDEPLAAALRKLMRGPLAPPIRPFPSSVYTESISSMDITSQPSPPLPNTDLHTPSTLPSTLHKIKLEKQRLSDLELSAHMQTVTPTLTSVILPSDCKREVPSVAFSPAGNVIMCGCASYVGRIQTWDIKTQRQSGEPSFRHDNYVR